MSQKMKFKFEDIEMAYDFVSSSSYGDHSAILREDTGKILYHSEMSDMVQMGSDHAKQLISNKKGLKIGHFLALNYPF